MAITSSSLSDAYHGHQVSRGLCLHASYLPERPCCPWGQGRCQLGRWVGVAGNGRTARVPAALARQRPPPGRLIRPCSPSCAATIWKTSPAGWSRSFARRRRRPSSPRSSSCRARGWRAGYRSASRARSAWRRTSASRFPAASCGTRFAACCRTSRSPTRSSAGCRVRHLRAILDGLDDAPRFEPLRAYLRAADECGSYELAARIADLFDQYLVYRPQWIARWEAGADEGGRRRSGARSSRAPPSRIVPGPGCRAAAGAAAVGRDAPASRGGVRHPDPGAGVPARLPPARGARRRPSLPARPVPRYWGTWRGRDARVPASRGWRAGDAGRGAAGLARQAGTGLSRPGHRLRPARRRAGVPRAGTTASCTPLQTDMLTLSGRRPDRHRSDDRSIQVHVCHGPYAGRVSLTSCCGCSSSTRT